MASSQARNARRLARQETPPQAPKAITLRMAVARDATALFDLLSAYFDLNPQYPKPIPMQMMAWGLTVVASNTVVVAECDGKIIASVGLEVGTWPWNRQQGQYLNCVWYYVHPDFAKGGTAGKLMKAAKDIAVANKWQLRMDNVWGVEPELQDRWREMHGLKYAGGNYVWFPPTGEE